MLLPDHCFTSFNKSIAGDDLPEKFTFPFYYQPHPLCLLAAKELQNYLQSQTEWQHNFGLTGEMEAAIGKMFGVLLVENKAGELGYLSAFSGKLAEKNLLPKFVPPVYDLLADDSFFIEGQVKINQINKQIEALESNPNKGELEQYLVNEVNESSIEIKEQREKIIAGRKNRKLQRAHASDTLNEVDFVKITQELAEESIKEKLQLRDLNRYWQARIEGVENKIELFTSEILHLKNQRKELSSALQNKIFQQYQFLNIRGELKNLSQIFLGSAFGVPPAGAGECALPKLLQYAFEHQMQPLAMAEFWWGASPKSEIRKHLNFYPSCLGKCQPILAHMLDGVEMDENALLINSAQDKSIEIIYEDEVMLVINKPAELLSVPGKEIVDSVYQRIRQSYPKATGALIVHRLDMATSGIMLLALTKEANKKLQKQFIKRTVKKRYVALLEGCLKEESGIINLPLRGDLDDRPRQLVCYEQGKSAQTEWQVIGRENNRTKVYFYPVTGRTHQLRVHSAHVNGLNMPIVGDDLYGDKSNRLYLHAESIEFNHPITGELMRITKEAEF